MIVLTLIRRGTVERSRCKQLIRWMSTPFFAHLTIRPKPVVQHLGSRPRQTASKDASPLLLTEWHRSIIIFACVSLFFRKHHLSENSSQQRQPFTYFKPSVFCWKLCRPAWRKSSIHTFWRFLWKNLEESRPAWLQCRSRRSSRVAAKSETAEIVRTFFPSPPLQLHVGRLSRRLATLPRGRRVASS